MRFSFYIVDSGYCDFLRKFDSRIPHTAELKSTRPFIGIVFTLSDFNYYAPLTSPKPKHITMKNQIDFLKINNGIWGAINFNNMIPIPSDKVEKVNMQISQSDTEEIIAYKQLLRNQLSWCNTHIDVIIRRVRKLYELILSGHARPTLANRCCDFKLLEEKCKTYQQTL